MRNRQKQLAALADEDGGIACALISIKPPHAVEPISNDMVSCVDDASITDDTCMSFDDLTKHIGGVINLIERDGIA